MSEATTEANLQEACVSSSESGQVSTKTLPVPGFTKTVASKTAPSSPDSVLLTAGTLIVIDFPSSCDNRTGNKPANNILSKKIANIFLFIKTPKYFLKVFGFCYSIIQVFSKRRPCLLFLYWGFGYYQNKILLTLGKSDSS